MSRLLIAVLVLMPTLATAQDLPAPEQLESQCAPELDEGRRAALVHGGAPGLWFADPVARCMLARYALLPAFARHVRLLEQRIQLSDERDALRTREVALAAEEAQLARDALEAALHRAREAEEARDAWYRHPALWTVVGVVLAGALVTVAAYALGAVTL